MNMIRRLAVASTLAIAILSIPLQPAIAAPASPVIESSSASATQLTINGSNFLPGVASVLLGPHGPLPVVTQTATQLVVTLPAGIAAGSYPLSVQITDKGKGAFDESVVTIGAVGPPGPKGDKGDPGLTSLAGIPCDTGSPDKPDGRSVITVAPDTGAITLKCLSSSTNPELAVGLLNGPLTCNTVFGVTICFYPRYAVQEVDAGGNPVANGFACLPGPPDLSVFPIVCTTKRFAAGTVVRLAANTMTGFTPSWNGCDSVNGNVCTLTLTAARGVGVTPEAVP